MRFVIESKKRGFFNPSMHRKRGAYFNAADFIDGIERAKLYTSREKAVKIACSMMYKFKDLEVHAVSLSIHDSFPIVPDSSEIIHQYNEEKLIVDEWKALTSEEAEKIPKKKYDRYKRAKRFIRANEHLIKEIIEEND